jgi:molybdopterin-guanine dinucleotide biosynthesis protein A
VATRRPAPADVTLGLLAGGAGRRLGGVDKAWLERGGVPQVVRIAGAAAPFAGAIVVSSNADPRRFEAHGWPVVRDALPGQGPIAGLDALARACRSDWLLTLPVDLVEVPPSAIDTLLATACGGGAGGWVEDADGPQPLVAVWRAGPLRASAASAIESGDLAVHDLGSRLDMVRVHLPDVRFGNLNTESDLRAQHVSRPGADDSR